MIWCSVDKVIFMILMNVHVERCIKMTIVFIYSVYDKSIYGISQGNWDPILKSHLKLIFIKITVQRACHVLSVTAQYSVHCMSYFVPFALHFLYMVSVACARFPVAMVVHWLYLLLVPPLSAYSLSFTNVFCSAETNLIP